jgi:DNA-binding NarL/FixJ family response regulator
MSLVPPARAEKRSEVMALISKGLTNYEIEKNFF